MVDLERAIYVIGAGPLALPTFRWAREEGLKLLLTDKNPEAPGLVYGDEVYICDGTDVLGHLKNADRLRESYDIRAVYCSGAHGYGPVSALRELLGLPRAPFENKLESERLFVEAGIRTPRALVLSECVDGVRYVVKPTSGSGSRGVSVVEGALEVESAYARLMWGREDLGGPVIQEYVEGRHIDANGIFVGGRFHFCGMMERWFAPLPSCLPLGGCNPVEGVAPGLYMEASRLLQDGAEALGITDGPVSSDMILDDGGRLWLLEIEPRFHGDQTTVRCLPEAGVNAYRFWFRWLATGESFVTLLSRDQYRAAMWVHILAPPGEVVERMDRLYVEGDDGFIWLRGQDRIEAYTSGRTIVGLATAGGDTLVEVQEKLERLLSPAPVVVSPDSELADWYRGFGERLDALNLPWGAFGYEGVEVA